MEAHALPQMASEGNHVCPCKRKAEKVWGQAERIRMAEGRVWIDADTMQEHPHLCPAAGVGEDASSPEPPREIWPGRLTT